MSSWPHSRRNIHGGPLSHFLPEGVLPGAVLTPTYGDRRGQHAKRCPSKCAGHSLAQTGAPDRALTRHMFTKRTAWRRGETNSESPNAQPAKGRGARHHARCPTRQRGASRPTPTHRAVPSPGTLRSVHVGLEHANAGTEFTNSQGPSRRRHVGAAQLQASWVGRQAPECTARVPRARGSRLCPRCPRLQGAPHLPVGGPACPGASYLPSAAPPATPVHVAPAFQLP